MRAYLSVVLALALAASPLTLAPSPTIATEEALVDSGAEAHARPLSAASDAGVAGRDEVPPLPPEVLHPEISLEELEMRLVPLTRTELAALAREWLLIVKANVEEAMNVQIALAQSDGAAAERLGERLSRLMDERRILIDKFNVVLNGWEKKGAREDAIGEFRTYRDAVIGGVIRVSNIKIMLSGLTAWLAAEDGGIAFAKKIAIAILALYGLILAAKIIRAFVRRRIGRVRKASKLLRAFLVGVVYWVVLFIGLILVLATLGVDSTALLALFGGASVIIGLALQDTLGNFANGLMIMVNRPFDEGDYVDIGGTTGTVKSVSIVATTITTPDNRGIVIPNKEVWGNVITNFTANETRRVDLVFSIGYDDDIPNAIRVLKDAVAAHPLTLENPSPTIAVDALAQSSVDILCGPWVKTGDYLTVYRELTADVKARFDAAGITIPYPQRELHLHAASGDGPVRPSDFPTTAENANHPARAAAPVSNDVASAEGENGHES